MKATKLIIALLDLCLATIVLASDPAKPNPPTEFTLSAFAVTENSYMGARVYYDQANQRVRTDSVDKDFNKLGEFIASWENNNAYWYDNNSGKCSAYSLDSKWVNAWSFLDDAVYWGTDSYVGDKKCDLWSAFVGQDKANTVVACFTGDTPIFIGSYNGTDMNAIYFITNFKASVDPAVFTLPSSCNSATWKFPGKSFMNLKKFKVPEHPLLF